MSGWGLVVAGDEHRGVWQEWLQSTQARFRDVGAVVLDEADGMLYVADATRIRGVRLRDGWVSTLAGAGPFGFRDRHGAGAAGRDAA